LAKIKKKPGMGYSGVLGFAVYFSPDSDLVESALTIPAQSQLFGQR
jgi:hypothetical protein